MLETDTSAKIKKPKYQIVKQTSFKNQKRFLKKQKKEEKEKKLKIYPHAIYEQYEKRQKDHSSANKIKKSFAFYHGLKSAVCFGLIKVLWTLNAIKNATVSIVKNLHNFRFLNASKNSIARNSWCLEVWMHEKSFYRTLKCVVF